MTRNQYLAQFQPSNRNHPALLWDRNQFAALAALPATDEVIAYGERIIRAFAQELEISLYSVDVRAMVLNRLAAHREIYGDLAHIRMSDAEMVSWDLDLYDI